MLLNRSFGVLGFAAVLAIAACGRSNLDDLDIYGGGGPGAGGPGGSSSSSSIGGGGSTSSSNSSSGSSSSSSSSSSSGGVCATAFDCDDGDNCTTDACVGGTCEHGPRDDDKDGHILDACGGDDCNDLNPNVPSFPENCTDGSDNDCNGVIDCADPACVNVPNCGCVPSPGGENCSNGLDDDCDQKVDCNDPGCIGTPACGCAVSEVGNCQNGVDDDCSGQIDCDDPDCFADPGCVCQSKPENCDNGVDDDCDLLIDCADPSCAGTASCACQPPGTPENCSNGVDDDCDGLVDCADPQCLVSPACQMCVSEVCTDGIDNNCDGKIDCADPACFFAPNCAPTPELCNNGLDDDNDGKIDCADTDCANNPLCVLEQANCLSPKLIPGPGSYFGDTTGHISETKGACGGDAGEAVFFFVLNQPTKVHLDSIGTSFDSTLYVRTGACNSGKEIGCDDDSAGSANAAKLDFVILYPGTYFVFLDGFTVDPNFGANEGPFQLNVEFTENPPEVCDDHIDNDGDHFVDCADPECKLAPNCFHCNAGADPEPEFGPGRCSNGKDDDCDGVADCADEDCSASDYYVTECCNGIDENGNGIIDDFNCRCATDATCTGGQKCYTHTVFACGIPCTSFFGDVCPFIAPGSFCNGNTQQCEF